jgi:hypothetical protein
MSKDNAPVQEREQTVRHDLIDLFAKRLVKRINKKADKPLEQVKEHLPSTPEQVRALPFYDSALDALRFQRDNYLVGTGFAKRGQKLRDRGIVNFPFFRMPFDSTALGNIQIIGVGASFIPSATIKDALLPIVVSLPSGVLKETITDAVANAIPLAHPQLDRAVKYSILTFMDNPEMRRMIKSRAGGYMISRDDDSSTGLQERDSNK